MIIYDPVLNVFSIGRIIGSRTIFNLANNETMLQWWFLTKINVKIRIITTTYDNLRKLTEKINF